MDKPIEQLQDKLRGLITDGWVPRDEFKNSKVVLRCCHNCLILQYLHEGEVAYEREYSYNDLIFGDSGLLEYRFQKDGYTATVNTQRGLMCSLSTADRIKYLVSIL